MPCPDNPNPVPRKGYLLDTNYHLSLAKTVFFFPGIVIIITIL